MREKPEPATTIESLLQHKFSQPDLLTRALTHRSLAHERRLTGIDSSARAAAATADNEQLEFLGDAVVGFLVAEDLCQRYPELREGELTRLRSELVSRRHLGQVAARLNLGEFMLLGRGEERSGGRKKSALLANCMEAVIAALYLDGGIDAARSFILREILDPAAPTLRDQMRGAKTIGDSKSALQELLQAHNHSQPEYAIKAESGPDHRKRFLVEVFARQDGVRGKVLARGVGTTRKKAEQEAARRAIVKLQSAPAASSKNGAVSEKHA
ncbi:MAG TPA: ribonuclease III [Acidobacteriaceae bacterium]|nr:ribonuclease III [Acidobacteriaceae bacterium]